MRPKSNLITISTLVLLLAAITPILSASCPDSYGISGYVCVKCPDSCDNCDTDVTLCNTCSKGSYLDASSTCQTCPSKCLSCSSPYQCNECTPGYDTAEDDQLYQYCVFYWWKWFLIIFGSLLGVALLILLFYYIRKKLKEEDNDNREIQYEMKVENTEANIP